MRTVIYAPSVFVGDETPIQLTHRKTRGWQEVEESKEKSYKQNANSIMYLGKCEQDGDMFAVYLNGYIMIFKGHVNSGKY